LEKYTLEVHRKERCWYLTEVLIGPVVVMAVFLLLKQSASVILSGIVTPEFSGAEVSIYFTMGLSFVLGYFIRRTLGIFDAIKDKLPLLKDIQEDKKEREIKLKFEKELREKIEKELNEKYKETLVLCEKLKEKL